MTPCPGPFYDLILIQALVRSRQYRPTGEAMTGLGELGFDVNDMEQCILALSPEDFFKTMPSTQIPGRWQDVYKPAHRGQPVYVKLQIAELNHSRRLVVVISFKRK